MLWKQEKLERPLDDQRDKKYYQHIIRER